MASLVDTNILVYRCDSSDPAKREGARQLLRAEVRFDAALSAADNIFEPRHKIVDDRHVADRLFA